ncbi:hypothetical protein DACRYDRAFT_99657 [Dacryopinax primogenitus]|uniref:Uncharacterized protein n=1 Tax=Dacryopinax primogenitus (strain DJM 731) TaxID=1858805 RepID=M5G1D1_DACPD|nr:uncharacterized protein DACRYDRAFT_99657 [Dacryopinax primogenitus]EJU02539.1 hypothetical protein DACRYDRAFT_99657 [Dacryopinax primogenitus]
MSSLHLHPYAGSTTPRKNSGGSSELEPLRRVPSPAGIPPPTFTRPHSSMHPVRRATSPLPARPSSPLDFPAPGTGGRRTFRPRRRLLQAVACFALFCLLGALLSVDRRHVQKYIPATPSYGLGFYGWRAKRPKVASEGALRMRGQKSSIRTNLRTDNKYITAWFHAGWTNDVMMAFNLIHLAKLTGRIPILPPFPPDNAHLVGGHGLAAGFITFSQIFDLPRLAHDIGTPIVEMHELKSMQPHTIKIYGVEEGLLEEPPEMDVIGCWSTWLSTCDDGCIHARAAEEPGVYMLNVHYTPIPPSFRRAMPWEPITFENMTNIARPQPNPLLQYYLKPSNELTDFVKQRHIPLANPAPDEHIACFDFLYFVSETGLEVHQEYTGRTEAGRWAGAWGDVGRYARWTPELEDLARGYLRRAFKLPDRPGVTIPPFIGIHIRRGDFGKLCPQEQPDCLPTVADHVDRLSLIRGNLTERLGHAPEYYLMTTDETDKGFLYEAVRAGWTLVDHEKERTVERFGMWYPTLLDSVMLSMSTGFLGTSTSTLSIMARRRVEDWNNGFGLFQPFPGGMGPQFDD